MPRRETCRPSLHGGLLPRRKSNSRQQIPRPTRRPDPKSGHGQKTQFVGEVSKDPWITMDRIRRPEATLPTGYRHGSGWPGDFIAQIWVRSLRLSIPRPRLYVR